MPRGFPRGCKPGGDGVLALGIWADHHLTVACHSADIVGKSPGDSMLPGERFQRVVEYLAVLQSQYEHAADTTFAVFQDASMTLGNRQGLAIEKHAYIVPTSPERRSASSGESRRAGVEETRKQNTGKVP